MEPTLKRIYIPENTDIRFERDPKTGEAVMYVCNEVFAKKTVPLFTETLIRKHFKQEIEDNKNVVCPTELGEELESEET